MASKDGRRIVGRDDGKSSAKVARTKARKAARTALNDAQHRANLERKNRGEMTPWEVSRAARKERRKTLRESSVYAVPQPAN